MDTTTIQYSMYTLTQSVPLIGQELSAIVCIGFPAVQVVYCCWFIDMFPSRLLGENYTTAAFVEFERGNIQSFSDPGLFT